MTLRLQSRANDRVFAEFKENRHMKRVAGFGSSKSPCGYLPSTLSNSRHTGTFLYYGPKLYECYCRYLSLLCDHDNGIADNWNFTNSIFSTTTVNFGPNTVCYNHLDFTNAAARWYTIMSAGNYDPKRGGHLILFDIKTVVKFPLGSTILIPSLVMRHSNTPIQKGETLSGITQYSAGTLFHWVDNSFMKAESTSCAHIACMLVEAPDRFRNLLNLYSTPDSLAADRDLVFGR